MEEWKCSDKGRCRIYSLERGHLSTSGILQTVPLHEASHPTTTSPNDGESLSVPSVSLSHERELRQQLSTGQAPSRRRRQRFMAYQAAARGLKECLKPFNFWPINKNFSWHAVAMHRHFSSLIGAVHQSFSSQCRSGLGGLSSLGLGPACPPAPGPAGRRQYLPRYSSQL